MSLRRYLFLLIGSLIILLSASQLALVWWIDKNMQEQVHQKAKILSEKMIEFAFNVEDNDHTNQLIEHEKKVIIKNSGNAEVIVLPEKGKVREVEVYHYSETLPETETSIKPKVPENKIDRLQLKKKIKHVIDQINQGHITTEYQLHQAQPQSSQQVWFEHRIEQSSTEKLIRYIQVMIIISALIALAFAFWLSTRFNRPLKHLAVAFQALAKGDYQQHVEPSGVKEIRETISQFNLMVHRLQQLTEQEKHNKDIENLAELGEVSRGLAHALRNPMHTIGLSVEQLLDKALDGEQRTALVNTIKNKIGHIDKNIKALLTLTTSGVDRSAKIPLLTVVQDIILEYKACENKPQQFDINLDNNIIITGAESEIRSILHTLIINACEASPENSTILITADNQGGYITLNVTDKGDGLTSSIKEKLFQPHVSTKAEGAGMGLYIAKRLLNLHYHGDIQLTDNNSQGCTATVCFKGKL